MQGSTVVKPKKRNLLDGIANRKSKPPKPVTDKDRYEGTRKNLEGRVTEAKKVGQYRTSLETLEKEAKQQAKQGRHDEALKTLNKLDLMTARALDSELAGMVDLLGRDLATFHELATRENVQLPQPDDLKTQFTLIGDLIANNNVSGAQNLLTSFKEGVEKARTVLKEVGAQLDGYGEQPPSLKSSHDKVRKAIEEGDSDKAREEMDGYETERQELASKLFEKLESLGPPPFDLLDKHTAVLNDIENDKLDTAVTGLPIYEQEFTAFEQERNKLILDLSGLGKAPHDLESRYNRMDEALQKGQMGSVREDIETYKNDLERLNALRRNYTALRKPPTALQQEYAAILTLIDRGAIDEAGAALTKYLKSTKELNDLANEFRETGILYVELAEQHIKISDLLDEGNAAEARKALETYKKDREENAKARETLRQELASLPTPTAKDLARTLQAAFRLIQRGSLVDIRKAIDAYKLAASSHTEDQEKLRVEVTKLIEETKKKLPEGMDELPTDLASGQTALFNKLEEGSLESVKSGMKSYAGLVEEVGKPERYTKRLEKVGERLKNARSSLTIGAKLKTGLEQAEGQAGAETPNYISALAHLDKALQVLNLRVKEIRTFLDSLLDRGLDVKAFMTGDPAKWHDEGIKGLAKTDADWLKKVEEELEKFRQDVAQAELKQEAQAPRSPTDLSNLDKVRERYGRGIGTGHDRGEFARNTEQARSVATQIITPNGDVDFGYLSMLPFGGDSSTSLLSYEVETSPEGKTSQSRHLTRMLNRLETDKNLRDSIEKVKAPNRDNFKRPEDFERVTDMIRATLGLPKDTVITDVHARQAAVGALLTEIRQVDVGSCFGTSVAIQVQKKKPERLIKDMQDLFTNGEIERTFTHDGNAVTVKIPLNPDMAKGELTSKYSVTAPDANLHETPQFSAALDAFGVGATERKAALEEAHQVLRDTKRLETALKALPTSVSAQTRKEIIAATLKGRKEGKTLEDILKEKGVKKAQRRLVAQAFLANRNNAYEATTEDLLAQVVRNRATTELTDEEVKNATEPGKTAFLAQRDNRLLRAWEYTVASAASQSPEHAYRQIMTEGAEETMLGLVNQALTTGKVGLNTVETGNLRDTCILMRDEVNKLLGEKIQFNYDASITHVNNGVGGDGKSSQGGWAMYYDGKKIESEEQYKAMMKDVIAKAGANVTNALPPNDPKTPYVATSMNGMNTGVDDGGFMAKALSDTKDQAAGHRKANVKTPWSSAGAGFSSVLMEVYMGQPITTESPTSTPTSEEDVVNWLVDMNRKMKTKIKDGVDLDPENVFVPLTNGPHAYSFRPGSPFFKKDLQNDGTGPTKTGAELTTEYKEKAAKRRATAFPLKDPPDGIVKKMIEATVNDKVFSSYRVEPLRTRVATKLKALGVGEVTAEQVKTAIEQAIDDQYSDPSQAQYRTSRKGACKKELGKAIQTEVLAPVDVDDLEPLMDNVLNKVGKHLSQGERATVKKTATEAMTSGGETEASMTTIQKAIFDAIAGLPPLDVKFGVRPEVKAESVLEALKPEGPPGIVFAETNWGEGSGQTLFSMIPDAFTDELQMWSVEEDGTMGSRQDKADWVTANWEMATNPDEYGGVMWGEGSPSGFESVPTT